MNRKPAVAGQFYPASASALSREVEKRLEPGADKQDAIGIISPHAGYMYSGSVVGALLSRVSIPRQVIILGPKHRYGGASCAIMTRDAWETPLGPVPIASDLARRILDSSDIMEEDSLAHASEHSIEVQLPFLQILKPDFEFVPLALGTHDRSALREAAAGLVRVIAAGDEPVLMVASSDMNHMEPIEVTRRKDKLAIDMILRLDEDGMFDAVEKNNITMCGAAPAYVMIGAARQLGATGATLVKYMTSGDVAPETRSSVVGYAGIIVR